MQTSEFRNHWPYFLFCLIGTGFTLPSFFSDYYSGHDALTHLIWSRHFAEQFWSGNLYPRWLMNMNDGLGSPAFYFYFPLPYFIVSLFHVLVLGSGAKEWLSLGLSCATAFSMSGITCYLWLRKTFRKPAPAPIVGALVYMFLPYHLLGDLYSRFAFTEFWAFAFMPLCLSSAERIKRGEKFGVIGAAVSYALLFLTHLPTVLIFSPVFLFYILAASDSGKRRGPFLRLAGAMVLGAGLSAFYWVPAILSQANVNFAFMTRGKFYFENNFLFLQFKTIQNRIELGKHHSFVTFSTLFTLAVCIFSWVSTLKQTGKNRRETYFWLFVCLFSFLMMLEVSSFIWHNVPFLSRIQFPYRFNLLIALAAASLTASAMNSLQYREPNLASKAWVVTICAFLISQIIISCFTVLHNASSLWGLEKQKIIDHELSLSPDALEYLPRWANECLFPVTLSSEPLKAFPDAEIVSGEGEASMVLRKPGRIELQTRGDTPLTVVVRHLYYPNWNANLDQQGRPLSVFPSPDNGLMSVKVPAGIHHVNLTLGKVREENLGLVISLVSVVVIMFLWSRGRGLTPATL